MPRQHRPTHAVNDVGNGIARRLSQGHACGESVPVPGKAKSPLLKIRDQANSSLFCQLLRDRPRRREIEKQESEVCAAGAKRICVWDCSGRSQGTGMPGASARTGGGKRSSFGQDRTRVRFSA